MTQRYFTQQATLMVQDTLAGRYSGLPLWADYTRRADARYVRAVQVADAFIRLAETWNKRFNRERFIVACGLKDGV